MAKKRKVTRAGDSDDDSPLVVVSQASPVVEKGSSKKKRTQNDDPVIASPVPEPARTLIPKRSPRVPGSDEFRNKEKVLVLSSRGIIFRHRHLMQDIQSLLPHSKKDSKVETRKEGLREELNELAELKGCSSCLFFEARKRRDLYMWMAKTPNGPSAKFLVHAIHTMAELKLTGNHLKGSRPILSFSPSFDSLPHLQLLKEMLTQTFGTPNGHRKSKPFFDHVFSFSFLDNHVWFRNYQISLPIEPTSSSAVRIDQAALDGMTLVETGPRFCLNPIKIFSGSFGGATLYENPNFVSPNVTRTQVRLAKAGKFAFKIKAKQKRKQHEKINRIEKDVLADVWKE